MGRKRKNKKIQTFEVYPEDLGRYQYLMNDLPKFQLGSTTPLGRTTEGQVVENTGETDEDINAAIDAQNTSNTSEEDEKAKLIQQMMKDNPEMFKDYVPRYNTSLYGDKNDYTLGNPQYNPLNPASPMGAMLGLFSAGKNLVKGIGTGFKTKYHGINPDTGKKYSMQDFQRHTITNPFDDTRLISKDVAFDILYNKNKDDYFRGDLFKTPQQANAMLMNDYFKDRHEMYTDADNPDQAAFSLRTMDDQGNVTYDDIEIPNPDYDPNEPTHPVNNPEFTTRPFDPLTDMTQGDRVEDHLANASMQQMYYDDKGVITKFQSYNDDGELVWTNYNPDVDYGAYTSTSQDELNRGRAREDVGGANPPPGQPGHVPEDSEESLTETDQDRQNRIRCEGEGKVYNPATGGCDDAPEGRYGLEQFVYGGTLPKFQDVGIVNTQTIVSQDANRADQAGRGLVDAFGNPATRIPNNPYIGINEGTSEFDLSGVTMGFVDSEGNPILPAGSSVKGDIQKIYTDRSLDNLISSDTLYYHLPTGGIEYYDPELKFGGDLPKAQIGGAASGTGYVPDEWWNNQRYRDQVEEMDFSTYQNRIIDDEEMYNVLNPPKDEPFDYENNPEIQQWYQDNPLSPVTSREGPFGSNVDEEIDWTEENEWSDIQDVDVQSSWRDEGETGIKGALAGAYRFGDAALKTGTLGRITKGLGDVAGLLDPLTALSNAWRMDREKTEAEMKKNARSSEDIFATVETSSRGDWDQWGGMYKPDKHIDEIRGTAQEGKETTLTGSTPQGGPDYSMLQEFTGDDLPFPYDPAFLEWQKLTLGINGGDLPKAQTGNKEKIKDYKNVWGTNKRETNAIIEDLINQGFDFETDTILRNPQATELLKAQNAFLDFNARSNIYSGNITGETSTNRSSWGDYMYQAYKKLFKQDGGQTVDIDSAMLKELIAAGADIEII
jgi:hypothetical protein